MQEQDREVREQKGQGGEERGAAGHAPEEGCAPAEVGGSQPLADAGGAASLAEQDQWRERCLRVAADFDNYRKRAQREMEQAKRLERERVLRSWLEVVDSAERALSAVTEADSVWAEGLAGMVRQMEAVLRAHGVRKVEAVGQPFDPNLHDAIATVPSDAQPDNHVLHVERGAFVFDDGAVLRPARVVVARRPR